MSNFSFVLKDKAHCSTRDLEFFERLGVPPPLVSPALILQNIMAFRNERKLYRRKCDYTGEAIISAYHADAPFPVYKNEIWWGDFWDPLSFGREFDFSKTFFEQYKELQLVVPREGTSVFRSENCEYNSHTRLSRNSYMNALVHAVEDSMYNYWIVNGKDIVDCYLINNSTLAYECIDCDKLYDCIKLQECNNCTNCYFSYQLLGCENCIGCYNLVRKKYHIANKPVSKEIFEKVKKEILDASLTGWNRGRELFDEAYRNSLHRCVHNLNCENCIGDHLLGCKNCLCCFDMQNCEDCRYSISGADSKDIYNCLSAGWPSSEMIYCSAVTRGSQDIAFCYYTFHSNALRYCDSSMNCLDCFGCIGLKKKQYCILNKQYSQQEYFALKKKIIAHMQETNEWGNFFPVEYSSFAYNESSAQDYFPLKREDVLSRGWNWRDSATSLIENNAKAIPESLPKNESEVLGQVFVCEQSGLGYKIIKPEIEFYKRMGLPLPRFSPESRHLKRFQARNPYQVFLRKCAITGEEIYSTFSAGGPQKVISEEAYWKEFLK